MHVNHQQPLLTSEHHCCTTKDEFLDRLEAISTAVEAGEYVPVLHFEMHGHKKGLELESEEILCWDELTELLTRINSACGNRLLVVMSACNGAHILEILTPLSPSPFWGVLGPADSISQSAVEKVSEAFYKVLIETSDGDKAVKAISDIEEGEKYVFMSCRYAFKYHYNKFLGKGVDDLINKFVVTLIANRGISSEHANRIARDQYKVLSEEYFNNLYDTFFMIEQNPENRSRFPLKFSDLRD